MLDIMALARVYFVVDMGLVKSFRLVLESLVCSKIGTTDFNSNLKNCHLSRQASATSP